MHHELRGHPLNRVAAETNAKIITLTSHRIGAKMRCILDINGEATKSPTCDRSAWSERKKGSTRCRTVGESTKRKAPLLRPRGFVNHQHLHQLTYL